MSSMSLGWSLFPSTVIIVLACVNSAVSPAGTPSISMKSSSSALLPVTIVWTGLLHLLVGTCVHCVRSDNEKYRAWPLPRAYHFQCVTHVTNECEAQITRLLSINNRLFFQIAKFTANCYLANYWT